LFWPFLEKKLVISDIIAAKLNAELDVVVSGKISAPIDPEFAIGAIMPDGCFFINKNIVRLVNVPPDYVDSAVNLQMREIERRLMNF
jgi:putative phosphoribosyl transferase